MNHPSSTTLLSRASLYLLLCICAITPALSQTAIPDTPAGHTLAAFLDAFLICHCQWRKTIDSRGAKELSCFSLSSSS